MQHDNLPPLPEGPATLRKRYALLKAAEIYPELREQIQQRAAQDCAWWIDYFVDIFDPRKEVPIHDKAFLLFDYQRDFIKVLLSHIEQGEDLLGEKSRDMGITYLVLAVILWHFLYTPGFNALLGSFRKEEVDDGTVLSLFGKLDYMIRRLPGWMVPRGYTLGKHRKFMQIKHPDRKNTNTIMGKAATSDFGRSGRYTIIFIDEGAAWDNLREAWTSSSQSSPCRVVVSTAVGYDFFYDLREQKIGKIRVVSMPWDLNPLHTPEWYAKQQERMTREEIARELNIDYAQSVTGIVYPTWFNVPKGIYPYQEDWALYISVDWGIRDKTGIIVWQRSPDYKRIRMIACYENKDHPIDFYVPFLAGEYRKVDKKAYSPEDQAWIAERSTWGPAIIYGDSAGNQRAQSNGRSVIQTLREDYGVSVISNAALRDLPSRKRFTEIGLRRLEVNIPACSLVDRCMSNAHYPKEQAGGNVKGAHPEHDWTEHFRSAVEFFYVNLPPPPGENDRPAPTYRRAAWQDLHT